MLLLIAAAERQSKIAAQCKAVAEERAESGEAVQSPDTTSTLGPGRSSYRQPDPHELNGC
jgi:hypothetical protein